MLKNSDVKEMADRSGELYMDQGDIGYAGAKIAVKRCFVLPEKIKLFLWLPGTCITNYFCIFDFFFTSACICKLKTVPELWKVYDLNLYNLFYQILWLLVALFICSYYGKEADTLASLRHARFMGSVTISLTLRPQNLPPSERAIHFHALRVHSQVCEWSNLDLECLSPLDWGWYQMKDTLEQIKLILSQHLLICQIHPV